MGTTKLLFKKHQIGRIFIPILNVSDKDNSLLQNANYQTLPINAVKVERVLYGFLIAIQQRRND